MEHQRDEEQQHEDSYNEEEDPPSVTVIQTERNHFYDDLPEDEGLRFVEQNYLDDGEEDKSDVCSCDDHDYARGALFLHSSHEHPLELTHVLHNNGEGINRNCNGCREKVPISADPHYFYCRECDYSLHKLCAKLPLTINHPLHPEHELVLLNRPIEEFAISTCHCCRESWSNFTYHCYDCPFDLDVKCATVGQRKIKHWHQHPLTLVSAEVSAKCYVCGTDDKGSFFHCTTCEQPDSWIHSVCALFPKRLPFLLFPGPDHEHPLVFSTTSRFKSEKRCDICDNDILKLSPRYECRRCKYSVHDMCSPLMPAVSTAVLYTPYEKKASGVPHMPFPDNSYSLVRHHFDTSDTKTKLNPFIHEHRLILFKKDAAEASTSFSSIEEDLNMLLQKFKLTCKLCGQLIMEAPFYRCPEKYCIDFHLHEWCANLPFELPNQPCHRDHPLILRLKYSQLFGSLGLFKCDVCGMWCDGFSFGCDLCDFHVDVNCAFLPDGIKHEAHPNHTLYLRKVQLKKNENLQCEACCIKLEADELVFRCDTCSFLLHTECCQAPRGIRHRYDKDFYRLTYKTPILEKEYFCDICEELIDTSQWFYDCGPCDQSMHAAYATCKKPSNKMLRLIRIGDHPHGFSLFSNSSSQKCSVCEKIVTSVPFFKCLTCGYAVDSWCVPKMIQTSLRR